jgi:hypothetical protein
VNSSRVEASAALVVSFAIRSRSDWSFLVVSAAALVSDEVAAVEEAEFDV